MDDTTTLLGYASGLAGVDVQCGTGPLTLQQNPALSSYHWEIIHPLNTPGMRMDEIVGLTNEVLAKKVSQLIRHNQSFLVLGGDHTSAIGTWSGVYDALYDKGDIGLIWVDAHMDSHTPETSHTGRIHGMPLASLLGYGYPTLTGILHQHPKIKPENVCLIATRSYEAGEEALLKRLNVKIYLMEEVEKRGLTTVWQEAVDYVNKQTIAYGVSFDLDSIDPLEAPGVDVPEPNGLHVADVRNVFEQITQDRRCIATEIVEFDPSRDKNKQTEKLIISLVDILMRETKGKKHD